MMKEILIGFFIGAMLLPFVIAAMIYLGMYIVEYINYVWSLFGIGEISIGGQS